MNRSEVKWHCVKDIVARNYCIPQPEWDKEPFESDGSFGGGNCKLDPKTCGRMKRIEDLVDLNAPWFVKPTLIETVIPIKKEEKEVSKKSKKQIEVEKENLQKSMF